MILKSRTKILTENALEYLALMRLFKGIVATLLEILTNILIKNNKLRFLPRVGNFYKNYKYPFKIVFNETYVSNDPFGVSVSSTLFRDSFIISAISLACSPRLAKALTAAAICSPCAAICSLRTSISSLCAAISFLRTSISSLRASISSF